MLDNLTQAADIIGKYSPEFAEMVTRLVDRPFTTQSVFTFEISAKAADDVVSSFQETKVEEPDANFTLFHAFVLYADTMGKAAFLNFATTKDFGLPEEELATVLRIKSVIGAFKALNYKGKEYNGKVKTSVGPHPTDPNKAILVFTI